MSGEKERLWSSLLRCRSVGRGVAVEGVEGVVLDRALFRYVSGWLDWVESRYPSDVVGNAVSILLRSLRELAAHRVEDFVPFGDYGVLDSLARQLRREWLDREFEPRPCMVVLYGPPGTGKTTWARQVAKSYLVEGGVLRGLYLELSVGDIASKWVGVPINTVRSVIEAVRTRDFMSVLLIDEADAILLRPREVTGGAALEQVQLVAELKSQLSFVTTQHYPTLILLTTNYRDAIVRADPALADRVVAWIEVPPPPLEARERIVGRALHRTATTLLSRGPPVGQLTKLRAVLLGGERFDRLRPVWTRWYAPALPYDADYLVGLLSAWGWSPLDPGLRLSYTLLDALRVWDPNNPLYRVYARVVTTLVELFRLFSEERHGVPRSFLRAFGALRRGLEDAARLYVHIYAEGMNALAELYYRGRAEAVEELEELGLDLERLGAGRDPGRVWDALQKRYAEALCCSLFLHPLNPTLLLHSMARYAASREFVQLVNDLMSLQAPITWGIRFALAPPALGVPLYAHAAWEVAVALRARLDRYNELVVRELREGELLAPLRAVYSDPEPERAWRRALELVGRLPEELRPLVKLCLVPLRELHPAIHSRSPEEKARKLYEMAADRRALMERLWRTVEELDVVEEVAALYAVDIDGIYERGKGRSIQASSLITYTALEELYTKSVYNPAAHIEDMGTVLGDLCARAKRVVEGRERRG